MGFFSKDSKTELEKTEKELDLVDPHELKLKKLQERKTRIQAKQMGRLERLRKKNELLAEKKAIRALKKEELMARTAPIKKIVSRASNVSQKLSKGLARSAKGFSTSKKSSGRGPGLFGSSGSKLGFGTGSKFDMGFGKTKTFSFGGKKPGLSLGFGSKRNTMNFSLLRAPQRRRRVKRKKR